jgi:hypothetical protein
VPYDFDPRHFDFLAYLPKARALARKVLPTAELLNLEIDAAPANGELDLVANPDKNASFTFANTTEPCSLVGIFFFAGHVTASRQHRDCETFKAGLPKVPRCTVPALFTKVKPTKAKVYVLYTVRGWSVDNSPFMDDDCK